MWSAVLLVRYSINRYVLPLMPFILTLLCQLIFNISQLKNWNQDARRYSNQCI